MVHPLQQYMFFPDIGAIGNEMMSFLVRVLYVISCDIQYFSVYVTSLDRSAALLAVWAVRCACAVRP